MISIIIPTLNAGATLPATLASLLEANQRGLIREVIISDGGSDDLTRDIAEEAGARVVVGPKGRGQQLIRGAELARGKWLLFLHADTQLSPDWAGAAETHIEDAYDRKAAVFRLAFEAKGIKPRLVALGANLRTRLVRLPYGDQGLLISRQHYDRLGGYCNFPLFEDVELIRRLVKEGGRRALCPLEAVALTSPERYVQEGYVLRVLRNARLLSAFFAGTPTEELAERYDARRKRRIRKASGSHGQAAPDGARQDPS